MTRTVGKTNCCSSHLAGHKSHAGWSPVAGVKTRMEETPAICQTQPTDSRSSLADPADLLSHLDREVKNSFDLSAVLKSVLSVVMNSVNADIGSMLVLDEAGEPSHWYIRSGDRGRAVLSVCARPIVQQGTVARAIRERRGDWVCNLVGAPDWWTAFDLHMRYGSAEVTGQLSLSTPAAGSALCLPLLAHGRVAGVLFLIHRAAEGLQAHHLTLLQAIAVRMALSIESARLYETARRRAEQMAALYEATLNISADQPLDRLLDTLIAQLMDLLRCQGGGVFLWREQDAHLELVAAYDPEIDLRGMRVAPGEGLVGKVYETRNPLVLDEHMAETGLSSGLAAPVAVAAPLIWQGQPLGVLTATDRTPGRHFDHDDRRLLTLLANQAAAVIAGAQLHEQTARQLKELTFLNETIQDITVTLNLDEIFAALTARVKDLLGIEACSIALVDRETNELVFRSASGGGAQTVVGERVPWGQGIVGAAAQSGRSVNVSNVWQDARFFRQVDQKQESFVTQSILAAPMISRGRVVGVVEGLNKPGGFDREDERLLSALAMLAASVVDNANLVSVQRELEQLRENLTHMIVHDLRSPIGTVANSLELLSNALREGVSAQTDSLIDIASRAVKRVLTMVESLLDISRLEAGQELLRRRPVSLPALARSAAEQLALYQKRKRIRLDLRWLEPLPSVMADEEMIERVLINLLDNAFKFSPVDSTVTLSLTVEHNTFFVRVQDDGPGIPPEHQQHIFDKFARVQMQNHVRGVGLGLAFCRLAIEAHGGRIWVESTSGQGSTFVFTLPLDLDLHGM